MEFKRENFVYWYAISYISCVFIIYYIHDEITVI